MKTIKKDVKSDGKSLGIIDVPQYENIAEMVKDLTEEKTLALANRQHSSDFTNEFRASQTREISPLNKLSKMAKTNPDLQKKIDALVAKYDKAAIAPETPDADAEGKG